ncbi:MAG: SLBB domain-containing protein [Gracilimonas sp.]|nr:SLBB domain-containing protein [Gracilimonas sp.]
MVSALSPTAAQQSNQQAGAQFNQIFNTFYYQDPLGSMMGAELLAADGVIDPSTYVLGPDDVLSIEINANNDLVLRAVPINSQGDIVAPVLGTVHLAGLTITEAKQAIQNKSDLVFRSSEVNVTLERAKHISFYVSGDVKSPGKHVLPAFSRIFDAIMVSLNGSYDKDSVIASQILSNGSYSFRNITIKHTDGSTTNADLISFLKAGHIDKNPSIQLGDQITLRTLSRRSPRVSISGAVIKPQEIEYSTSDTPDLLIEIAGGLSSEADTTKAFVYRENNDSIDKIEVRSTQWENFNIEPNDRIVIPKDPEKQISASARIEGEVIMPGIYPIQQGETTAYDLLQYSEGLTGQALSSAAYLVRAGNIENEAPNKLNPRIISRTSDQIQQEREYLEMESQVSRDKVYIDLNDTDQLQNVKLFDGDRIFIPRDENTIFVFGQVNNPGYYPAGSSTSGTYNYIDRAGGFSLAANKERIFIIKAGSNTWYRPDETELETGDRIFVDRIPYDELNAQRTYETQRDQIKNSRVQLIMTGIATITGIITTYVAIQNN